MEHMFANNTNTNKYFYKANIQPPTSVSCCISANFVQSPKTDQQFQQELQFRRTRVESLPQQLCEVQTNAIIAKSNSLIISSLNEENSKIYEEYEIPFSDQIIHLLAIPIHHHPPDNIRLTNQGVSQTNRNSGLAQVRDSIFVLTSQFHCCLISHNEYGENKIVSHGNIEDTIGQKKDAPYSIFLAPNNSYIALLLYENLIKIIPVIQPDPQSKGNISLGSCFNVRIRHANTLQILPLYESYSPINMTQDNPKFGVVYIEQVNYQSDQGLQISNVVKMRKYHLNIAEKDIIDNSGDDLVEFESSTLYLVIPLLFGGFIAFDEQNLYCYLRKRQRPIHQKFNSKMTLNQNSIQSIDSFNNQNQKTTDGSHLFRYIFGTEEGEIYLLAFNLDQIFQSQQASYQQPPTVSLRPVSLISSISRGPICQLEPLGKLQSQCQSLAYFKDGLLYFGSLTGDSYLIQITYDKNQNNQSQPHTITLETYSNFGPILDMKLIQNQTSRNSLLVTYGDDKSKKLAVFKKGVSIKEIQTKGDILSQLPKVAQKGFFCIYNKIFFLFEGIPQIFIFTLTITKKASNSKNQNHIIHLEEFPNSIQLQQEQDDADPQLEQQYQQQVHESGFNFMNNEELIGISEVILFQNSSTTASFYHSSSQSSNSLSEQCILIVTSQCFVIYSEDISYQKCQYQAAPNNNITQYSLSRSTLLITLNSQTLLYFNLQNIKQQEGYLLKPSKQHSFDYSISAISMSSKHPFAYVGLWDAPVYSFMIIYPKTMQILSKRSVAGLFEGSFFKHLMMSIDISTSTSVDIAKLKPKQVHSNLNSNFSVAVVKDIQVISLDEDNQLDFVLCSCPNGNLLSFYVDISLANQILISPHDFPPQLYLSIVDLIKNNSPSNNSEMDGEDGGNEDIIWGIKMQQLGKQEIRLQKIRIRDESGDSEDQNEDGMQECVVVGGSKPIIYYPDKNKIIKMLNINNYDLQQLSSIIIDQEAKDSEQFVVYETVEGQIKIGELEKLSKLQTQITDTPLKVVKLLQIPSNQDHLICISKSDQKYVNIFPTHYINIFSLFDNQFCQNNSFELDKQEIGNSLTYCTFNQSTNNLLDNNNQFNQKGSHNSSEYFPRELIIVGTFFANVEESLPSKGRILILEYSQQKLELVMKHQTFGSVQAMQQIKQRDRILIAAINNEIHVFQIHQIKNSSELRLEGYKSIEYGKLATALCVLDDQIVMADFIKGLKIFDFKEGRPNQLGRQLKTSLVEGPQSSFAIMSNFIIPITKYKYMLFDLEQNIFIYQRNIGQNASDIDKLKLRLIGCMRLNETPNVGIIGSLTSTSNNNFIQEERLEIQSKILSNKNKRKTKKSNSSSGLKEGAQEDEEMKEEDKTIQSTIENERNVGKLRADPKYLQFLCTEAYKSIRQIQSSTLNQILYGTQEGSINTLIEIPEPVYNFLKLLSYQLEESGISEYGKLPTGVWKDIKTQQIQHESFAFIEGNFIENFISFDPQLQIKLISHMFGIKSSDQLKKMNKQLKIIIEYLKELH